MAVLVTGGGRGLGRSIAVTFARAETDWRKFGKEVEVILLAGDITDLSFNERLFETAGELDVLINNAGSIETRHRIHDSDPEEWWGIYLPTREFLRRNLGRPLTISSTSSILSANTIPGYSVYYSSKSLINRFTEFLHFEYQQDGVRTVAYHPGISKKSKDIVGYCNGLQRKDADELLAKKEEIVQKGLQA
ncbi:hypothetical protein M422DRAFT_263163 [Sphaerobolus stellatus SS14]|uniref:Unplaced genomic scaffold SPHSTscaffold_122, whole genome shotgun sequence n=1 Tax=Sphaerobolus stellatus (strain SS14) TaxID=990650 RepID=A0A0C9VBC0_SPHS4|nr:hypothetical protein M422DRAFT_275761 [Sphaerobolus stellatus SS14]KIJ34611.1 hypothetical protein M422DRAFT_263163 [Sphaerobolus stellatus SS14]